MTLACLRILFFAYFCFSSFGAASLAVFEIDGGAFIDILRLELYNKMQALFDYLLIYFHRIWIYEMCSV